MGKYIRIGKMQIFQKISGKLLTSRQKYVIIIKLI